MAPPERDPPTAFGRLIRERRRARKIGRDRLAAEAGVSVPAIAAWENRDTREPGLRAALRVAMVLGIDLDELSEAAIGDWVAARNEMFHGQPNGSAPAAQIVAEATEKAEDLARQAQRSARRRDSR